MRPGVRSSVRDPVVEALNALVPGGVVRGGVRVGSASAGRPWTASLRSRARSAGGRMVRWVEAGSASPTVVLAAGRNDTAISWTPILAALAARTRVVVYDRAGLGASDPDAGPGLPVVERQVSDLAAVIGQTSAGPCVVAGHSWGGLLAQVLAYRRPELVAGLVLVDPAHEDMMNGVPAPVRRLNLQLAEQLPSVLLTLGLLKPFVRRQARRTAARFSDDPRVRMAVVDAYLVHAGRTQVRASRDELRGIVASTALLWESRAAASSRPLKIPLVVLSATQGAPLRIREHWTKLQAGIVTAAGAGKGRHVVVADAGHTIHHDWPDLVAEVILEVVDQVRQGFPDPGSPSSSSSA
jgi:pimeloyl-ACP methyl ester carboxylesterase